MGKHLSCAPLQSRRLVTTARIIAGQWQGSSLFSTFSSYKEIQFGSIEPWIISFNLKYPGKFNKLILFWTEGKLIIFYGFAMACNGVQTLFHQSGKSFRHLVDSLSFPSMAVKSFYWGQSIDLVKAKCQHELLFSNKTFIFIHSTKLVSGLIKIESVSISQTKLTLGSFSLLCCIYFPIKQFY